MSISMLFLVLCLFVVCARHGHSLTFGKQSTAKQVVDGFSGDKSGFLSGKTALVTGANSGIGLETAKALASQGCRVIFCSRSVSAAKAAVEKEVLKPGLGEYTVPLASSLLVVKELDLDNILSIKKLAQEVEESGEKLDLLVLNAGIMSLPTLEKTRLSPSLNWEKQMGVNHLAHAALTKLLIPRLEERARIVVLASSAHNFASADFLSDLSFESKAYLPWVAYGNSKLANLLFAKGLAKNLPSSITACSVHPGVIKTNLWNQSFLNKAMSLFVADKTIPQGAATTLWACLAPRVSEEDMRGVYLADCAIASPSSLGQSETLVDALWLKTEEELAKLL